jgi:hypothetical protein
MDLLLGGQRMPASLCEGLSTISHSCLVIVQTGNGRLAEREGKGAQKMDTFLPPIEKPRGLMMKLAYYFTRRQCGKVLTPLKVHSARLPAAFGLFYSKVSKLDRKLLLSPEMVMLIREKVAGINVCLFCIDIARSQSKHQ